MYGLKKTGMVFSNTSHSSEREIITSTNFGAALRKLRLNRQYWVDYLYMSLLYLTSQRGIDVRNLVFGSFTLKKG
jgi:hypothetical protein